MMKAQGGSRHDKEVVQVQCMKEGDGFVSSHLKVPSG